MTHRFSIAFGFLGAILAGALLLMLPCSSPHGAWMPFSDALFTACSAVCITGLTVIDPGTQLSVFGQVVLTCLVELGCLGIMTLGTFFLIVTGRQLSLASEFSVMNAYGQTGIRGFRGLTAWIVLSVLGIELVGTVVLWLLFTRQAPSWSVAFHDGAAWYRAGFYAVMAFCNAGFSIDPGSLAVFRHAPFVLVTLGLLVLAGGLGFLVLYNICTIQFWRRNLVKHGRLSLHSLVMVRGTAIFLALAFVAFLALEWRGSLASFDGWWDRLAVSFFHAVTPRTAGYTVIPLERLHPATRFIDEVLMFIGAGPGSAGGGVKLTTFVVFLCTVGTMFHGGTDVVLHRRSIPMNVVREACVIFLFAMGMVAIAMTCLLVTESGDPYLTFERLFFESVSAVTTTGLSCGETTAHLSTAGRCIIMACMFVGRLGALTVVLMIAGREDVSGIRYPREELVVG